MDALLMLDTVSYILDVRNIRPLYDSIKTHIWSLKTLTISPETYGAPLVPLILAKIPEEMRLHISRNVGKNDWKIDELLKEFKTELEARERCTLMSTCSSTNGKSTVLRDNNNNGNKYDLFQDTTKIQLYSLNLQAKKLCYGNKLRLKYVYNTLK